LECCSSHFLRGPYNSYNWLKSINIHFMTESRPILASENNDDALLGILSYVLNLFESYLL